MTKYPAEYRILRNLGYEDGIRLQRESLARVANDRARPGEVLFVEHRPVITCGRSGDGSNLLVDEAKLREEGIEFFPASRGGDVTYHGPGQWTVYPILRLDWYGRSLHRYLRLLEECVIVFLAKYGIEGGRREGLTGAWVCGGKVAAVGVAVSRWVTWHGFALNINTDTANFTTYMHPCGIHASEGSVATLAGLTGVRHDMLEVLPTLRDAMAEVLSLDFGDSAG
ncbi:MAG: lipoyl(octanoyl) transferase LipB [Planctomycetaceae bacterium]|nr:lipoyl(octanoyl) transferase LipB [Planctomycetaceae bacterium]